MNQTNLTGNQARQRYYKPKSYRQAKETAYWRNKFLINLFGITAVLLFLWFIGLRVVSGLDNFWNFLGKDSSEPIPASEDKIAPQPPYLSPISQATKERKINLTGFAENESEVELFKNESSVAKTFAGSDGKFTFTNIALDNGNNLFYAKAKDKNGNVSEKSQSYTISTVNEAPQITLETPKDGEEIKGKTNRTITVSGKVAPTEVTLTINDTLTIVSADGSFTLRMSLTQNGTNEIKVKAVDKAGNETAKTIKVTYDENSD